MRIQGFSFETYFLYQFHNRDISVEEESEDPGSSLYVKGDPSLLP